MPQTSQHTPPHTLPAPTASAPHLPRATRRALHRRTAKRLAGAVLAASAVTVAAVPAVASAGPTGIDVASYQHPSGAAVNWPAVAASGLSFVFAKATEGPGYTNPYFAGDRSSAIAAGMAVGAYHFARPENDPVVEAQHFLAVNGTGSPAGRLPPVLDLETTGGRTPAALSAWALTWLRTVQAATGRAPFFYSYSSFLRTSITPDPALASYPLWIASYSSVAPSTPAPWSAWTFWQYTDQGAVPGISGNVDHSQYAGTLAELRGLAGLPGGTVAPPRPTGDLYATVTRGTGSGRLELHALSRASGYRTFTVHAATPLGVLADPARWTSTYVRDAVGRQDLVLAHAAGTASGRLELHTLSAASNYQQFTLHVATALPSLADGQWQFALAPYAGDHARDLYAIRYAGSGSGRVEVHVLSAASNYQRFLLQTATALGPSAPGRTSYLVDPTSGDLTAVMRSATGSGHTEAHTLTAASGYRTFSLHTALPLGPTPGAQFQYDLEDQNGDGVTDLELLVLSGTQTRTTELHVLSGAQHFTGWSLHTSTGLPALDPTAAHAGLAL